MGKTSYLNKSNCSNQLSKLIRAKYFFYESFESLNQPIKLMIVQ